MREMTYKSILCLSIAITLSNIWTEFLVNSQCSDGWITAKNLSFCYKYISTQGVNYTEALSICEEESGQLIMPKTQKENEFMKSIARNMSKGDNEILVYWIGLDEIKTESEWVWIDGDILEETKFIDWHARQPNNYGNQDCAVLGRLAWMDKVCSKSYHVICQRELNDIGQRTTLSSEIDQSVESDDQQIAISVTDYSVALNLSSDGNKRICICDCQSNFTNFSRDSFSHLIVDKKMLSSYKRKFISAVDQRTSARATGYCGIVILCVLLFALLAMDCSSVMRHCKRHISKPKNRVKNLL